MNEVEKAELSVLFALFVEFHIRPNDYVDLEDLYARYHLTFPRAWLASSASDWEAAGWVDVALSHDSTAAVIERSRYNAVLKRLLFWLDASSLRIDAGKEEIFSDRSAPPDIPMIEGWKWFTYAPASASDIAPAAPASDRIVRLDHNSASYAEVDEGLKDVTEAVRGHNGDDIEDRDRVLASLDAAGTLWSSTELRIIQIKVGVLMAAEDAAHALANTAKAVAAALLVDIIKAYVKNHFGVDLDKI